MRFLVIFYALAALCRHALADGQVFFNTHIRGGVDAPFTRADGTGLGAGYTAGLFLVNGTTLLPLFPTTTFRTDPPTSTPYVNSLVVTVPNLNPGQTVTLRMRAWKGANYETAACRLESGDITVVLGGDVIIPPNLTGLQGAQLQTDCETQGSLRFETHIDDGVDAPFKKFDGTGLGTGYTAALFLVKGNDLLLLSPTTTFDTRSPLTEFYVNPVDLTVPGTFPGQTITLRMRAWKGASFQTAACRLESADFTATLGGGATPPAKLTALKGASMLEDCEAPPVVKGTPLFTNLKSFVTRLHAGDPDITATTSVDGPKDIVVADLNGDGLADIALSNVDGTVTVYFSLGDGHFTEPLHLHTGGTELRGIIAADFDGDGLPEIATAAPYDGALYLFMNQGEGVFSDVIKMETWLGARNLTAGDFDGDGHQDLVVAGQQRGLQQYRGLGNGQFETKGAVDALNATTEERNFPKPVFSLKAYRPVGATKDELIATHAETNLLWRLIPDAAGQLQVSGSITNEFAHSLDIGPIVGPISSGLSDIVTAHRDRGFVLVRRGDYSNAGFEENIRQRLDIPGGPRAVQLVDLDNDGWNDLVVVLRNFNRIITYKNVNGTFVPATELPVGASPRELGSGDINHDGFPDIAVMNRASSDVTILPTANGQTSFTSPDQVYTADGEVSGLALVDFNGDGRPDVVQLHRTSGEFSVRLTANDGSLGPAKYYLTGNVPADQAIVDVNNDHIMDLVAANLGRDGVEAGSVSVRLGNADGTFQPEQRFVLPEKYSGNLFSIIPADFDGDGNIDLAAGYFDCRIAFFKGNGDGTFTFTKEHRFLYESRSMTAGDFDQDGDIDLAGISYTGEILVIENKGDLLTTDELTRTSYPPSPDQHGALVIRSIDYNHDGDIDLLVGTGNGASIYVGGPGMKFTREIDKIPGTSFAVSSIALADFDGDGQLDMAVACQVFSCLTMLTRVGDEFLPAVNVNVPAAKFIATGDLDGDGQPDLVGTGDVLWTALSSRRAAGSQLGAASLARQSLPLRPIQNQGARPTITTHPVINEFLAVNDALPMEGDGGRKSDWIELYNGTESNISLEGWRLTVYAGGDPAQIQSFQFPSGIVLPLKGYLLVYCSNGKRSTLHTDFGLPGEGGLLVLENTAGQEVDSVPFGPQQANVSYARYIDAHPSFVFNPFPNPGRSNRDNGSVDPAVNLKGVLMNSAKPNSPIRFYAHGKDDQGIVSLSLLYRRLDIENDSMHRVVLYDDGLNGDGGMLDGLFSGTIPQGLPAGAELQFYVEAIDLSDHAVIIPDEPVFAARGQPLRLYTVGVPAEPPRIEISEIVSLNTSGVQDEAQGYPDWIEIRNHSQVQVPLDGIRLTADVFGNSYYEFPSGSKLAPGEHRIVFCDGKTDQGSAHAPFNLASDGGYIALFTKSQGGANTILDSVAYPAQGPNTSFARIGRGGRWMSTLPTPNAMNLPRGHMAAFSGMSPDGPILSLAFPGALGKHYLIEAADRLNPAKWTQLGTITGEGLESVVNYFAQEDARFYRVSER
jgi:hypothetical protein